MDVAACVFEGLRIGTKRRNALGGCKVYHSKHKTVVLQSRPFGYVHPLTFQIRIGIENPRFVNHTSYEVKGKRRVDVITTALAKAAEPAERAKEVFQKSSF